jgi:pimeloyl-ACP methyl ester carboxylesterase
VYPGGHVDPRAYSPLARQIAARGYRVVIVPMPLALAVLAPDEALDVMAANPKVSSWAIGGHSLGGTMAARFTYAHPDAVDGLVLWAAYPASTDDLSGFDGIVTSVYGTLDGLATGDKIDASRSLLPPDTRWVLIEGGNHAQFGDYGAQSGDGVATIPAAEQQTQAAEATVRVLETIVEAAR